MKVIFLIAGKGSRLSPHTIKIHKSLIKINNQSIIGHLIKQFHHLKVKRKDITFITGYKSYQIKKEFGDEYNYLYYGNYSKTNNLHTMIYANKILKNHDTIICFSDILCSKKIIEKTLKKNINKITALVDLSKIRNGTMKVVTNKKKLISIGKLPRKKSSGNFIGILKIPREKIGIFRKFLLKSKNKNKNFYYTEVLNDLIQHEEKIDIINVAPNYWTEVDNILDLKMAIKNSFKLNE